MGGSSSKAAVEEVDDVQVEEIKMISNFTNKEVTRLMKIFKQLDADGSGTIDRDELFSMPQFKANPFINRIIQIADDDEGPNGEILPPELDIKEFAKLMSVFSVRATREQKLRYAFKVYDHDGDDRISREDLQVTINLLTDGKMEPEFLEEVLTQVFIEADSGGDGYIDFSDFAKVVLNTDIEGKLTFDF
ncbi:calcineurin regulatory subunit B [Baffinella frigidus]|nr:calcineurin regulatory subunit B [Cryptophyta sp. CCMP2293]